MDITCARVKDIYTYCLHTKSSPQTSFLLSSAIYTCMHIFYSASRLGAKVEEKKKKKIEEYPSPSGWERKRKGKSKKRGRGKKKLFAESLLLFFYYYYRRRLTQRWLELLTCRCYVINFFDPASLKYSKNYCWSLPQESKLISFSLARLLSSLYIIEYPLLSEREKESRASLFPTVSSLFFFPLPLVALFGGLRVDCSFLFSFFSKSAHTRVTWLMYLRATSKDISFLFFLN